MKYQVFIVLLMLSLFSCKNDNQKVAAAIEISAESDKRELTVEDIELEIVDFEGLRKYLEIKDDKTYVLNFWATWCAPCVKELPHFERLNDETSDDDVEVILVSLDFPSKYESNLKPYIIKKNLKSKVIALDDADSNTWIPKISEDWSGAIPATLIYNKSKKQFYEGSFTYKELQDAVKPYLK